MGKMMRSDEAGPVRLAPGMPVKIIQGAQYMNDVMGSMYGKLIQAVNYQKSTEFHGGIWDCNPVKEMVPSKSCIDTSNNSTNKIFSLEEMLYEDEDVTCGETEMTDDYLLNSQKPTTAEENVDALCTDESFDVQNKVTKFSANSECTDESMDVKNKRWISEEFDKASLPCNNTETKRKKSKKNVSFSDIVVDLEESFKSTSKINKCIAFDTTAIKDDASNLKETHIVKENERLKNLVLENVNDIPIKRELQVSVLEKKSVKESIKVKNGTKLVSQSCEIDHHAQPNDHMPIKVGSSKKLSHKRCSNQRDKSKDIDHEKVVNTISDNHEIKNEEFINRSHLEKAIPELFQLSESKIEDKADPSSMKNIKNKLKWIADQTTNIQNLALKEIKETSQPFEKKNVKGAPSCIDVDLSKNEVKFQTFVEDRVLKEIESNEDCLKNSLFEMCSDVTEKDKITKDNKQINCVLRMTHEKSSEEKSVIEKTCHGSKFLTEDESQYESKNSAVPNELFCPSICDKPSCEQQNCGRKEKDFVDIAIKADVNRTDNKSEKVSLASYKEKNCSNSVYTSRSDSCSNWRSQCVDVQSREKEENMTQSCTVANWRNECRDTKNQSENNSKGNNHKTRRTEKFKKMQANKIDVSSKVEYEEDDLVVIPFYFKEPPDPLSRFKNTNNDPESIWDEREVTTRPPPDINRIQSQIDNLNSKNDSEIEEVHAFRKNKTTSVPKFFDKSTRTLMQAKPQDKICEDHSSPLKVNSTSSRMSSENYRSRSQSRQADFVHHRSYERNRSSSARWRSSLFASCLEHDVFYVVKITDFQEGKVEKLKILKENFLLEMRGNTRLSNIIPSPEYKPKKIAYSACAVKIFIRCIFSLSYQIPSWITALEAFALAKKFGVDDLKKVCEDYFTNYKISSEQIELVAAWAHQLNAFDALKSSKIFQKVLNFNRCAVQNVIPQSCMVSCSVFTDTSELVVPLKSEVNRGIEAVNEADVKNRVFFTSLAHVTYLTGIQLKFLTDDINAQLKIICEVFQSKKGRHFPEKLFCQEIETNAKSSIKISFTDEIIVKLSDKIEIVVYVEDLLLKICPQLHDNEIVIREKFHVRFETSKTNENNKKLFCIEKLFYTSQA